MKKQPFRYLAGIIVPVVFFTSLHAQHQNSLMKPNQDQKALNEFLSGSTSNAKGTDPAINQNAVNDFVRNFKNSGIPSWFRIKDGFQAKFEKDGVQTRVFYDLKGRWSSTILTYGQDKLPADVRRQVKSTYYDYNIYLVNEITVTGKIIYMVSIEDNEGYKIIRVTDDDTSVYEEFLK